MADEKKTLGSPRLRYDPFTDRFVLIEPYVTPEYTIPVGEYTDGASRPEIASIVGVKQYDRHLPACIVHDWMYRNAIKTKKAADDLFEINLIRCAEQFGFDKNLIPPMVGAVRIFGKGAYK